MASTYNNLRALNAAIETTPLIDNHAHPLLKPEHLAQHPLLSIATEAHGDAIEDSRLSLAHIRATGQLAQVLGCEPTWDAVAAAIERQRAESPEAWTRRCLEGIETILIDDGLNSAEKVQSCAWHDDFTRSKCKRIVRIEALAGDIIARYCESTNSEGPTLYHDVVAAFRGEVTQAIADPEVVGFKSIICYRGGLDIGDIPSETTELTAILDKIALFHRSGKRFQRLQHPPLNQLFVHITAHLIESDTTQTTHRKPIQFHTGLGDNDITLTKSSPSHLQTFIRIHPTVPVVLLHAGYPWMKETAYLATMYSNVYADIGEVFPFVSRHGQENVVREILELCPWSKVLLSTDGHWFPETYILATIQARSVFKTVSIQYALNLHVISLLTSC